MSKQGGDARGSATTTVADGKEKTLVLRLREQAEGVRKEIFKSIPEVGGKMKADIKGSKSKDPKETIQQSLARVKAQYNQQLDNIQEQILSYEPKEPVRQPGQTDEEFQQLQAQYEKDLEAYDAFTDQATAIVDEIVNLISDAIEKLRKYSDYVWSLIKSKDPDLDKKAKEFLKNMADSM